MKLNQKNAIYIISYQNFLGENVYEKIWKIGSSYNVLNRLISYKTYSPFRFKVEKVFIITNNPFKEDGVNTDSVAHILDDLIQKKIDQINNDKIYRTHPYNKKNKVYEDIKILKKEDNLNIGGTEWYYTNDLKELILKIKKILDDLETKYIEYDTIEIHEMISDHIKNSYDSYKDNISHSTDFPKKKKYSTLKNKNKYLKKIKIEDYNDDEIKEYKIDDEKKGEECKIDDNCRSKCCKNNECVDGSLCKIKEKQISSLEIQPYFHQYMIEKKILKMWDKNKQFLIGAMPRSGKSYIMSFLIRTLFENKILNNNSILVITTYPTETIEGYKDAINDIIKTKNIKTKSKDIENFMKKYKRTTNDIVILSIQSLFKNISNKKIKISELKKIYKDIHGENAPNGIKKTELMDKLDKHLPKEEYELNNKKIFNNFLKKFNVIFTDEFHYSGKTNNSVKILKDFLEINEENKIIHMSGTYISIKKRYNIKNNNVLNWEYEDIKNMKGMEKESDMLSYLDDKKIKHDIYIEYKKQYNKTFDDIINYYKTFPEPKFLFLKDIIEINKLFMVNEENDMEFLNMKMIKKVFDNLFYTILPYIKNFSEKNNSRTLNSKLTYKNNSLDVINSSSGINKTGIIIFLPETQGKSSKVGKISYLLEDFINETYKNEYNILSLNSSIDIKKKLEKKHGSIKKGLEEEFKKSDKTMIIIVRGMLEAGISLKFVDIVIKLHSSDSYAKNQQQTYRASTEDAQNYKKYSWIIDYNKNNTLKTTLKQVNGKTKSEKIEKIKKYNMILDPYNPDINISFEEDNYYEYIDDIFKQEKLNFDIKKIKLNTDFLKNFTTEIMTTLTIMELKKNKNSKGKVNPKNPSDPKEPKDPKDPKEPKEPLIKEILDEEKIIELLNNLINYMTFINYFYKMEENNLENIFNKIKKNKKYSEIIEKFIFSNYIKDKKVKFNINTIIEEIMIILKNIELEEGEEKIDFKDLNNTLVAKKNLEYDNKLKNEMNYEDKISFIHNLMNPTELSKKNRAEVLTPIELIEEMLNELPSNVWNNMELKWLDPASGIGNFQLVIYKRLMNGLKKKIPDEKEREKHILENMIYYAEINELNSFIYRKLIDPENKYKLNIYTGDSISNKFIDNMNLWNIKSFDIIIGNPPYKNGLYLKFFDFYNELFNNYMVMIAPSTWFYGLKEDNKNYIKHMKTFNKKTEKVILVNGNFLFNIGQFTPLAITLFNNDYNGEINVINKLTNEKFNVNNLKDIHLYSNNQVFDIIKKKYENVVNKYGSVHDNLFKEGNYYINIARIRGHVEKKKNKLLNDDFFTFLPRTSEPTEEQIHNKLPIGFNTKEEANIFLKYLNGKIARFGLSILKIDQNMPSKQMSLVPFFKDINDYDNLIKIFNFNNEEIEFINKKIPDY